MASDISIQPTQTFCAGLVVLLLKKKGTIRFGVDHSKLNAVTKPCSYSISHTGECIDSLGSKNHLLTLDASSSL